MDIFVATITFGLTVIYIVQILTHRGLPVGQGFWTTTFLLLFLGGVQMISIGILGEYIGRIYEEIKQRPLYVVREKLGFDEPAQISPPQSPRMISGSS